MNEISPHQDSVEPPSLTVNLLQKPSGIAKASFILGIASIVIWTIAIGSIMVFVFKSVGTSHKGDNLALMPFLAAGFLILISFLLNLIGLILGMIEIRKSIPNRWMAITGIAINGGIILFSVGVHYLSRGFLHHAP